MLQTNEIISQTDKNHPTSLTNRTLPARADTVYYAYQKKLRFMWRAEIKNHAFERFGEEFHPLLDSNHFLGRSSFDIPYQQSAPLANIRKDGDRFELEMAVPGFSKEEIKITLEDDILTVKGEKSRAERRPGAEFILEEFDFDSFERAFKLAPGIVHDQIAASCEHGILKLSFTHTPVEDECAYRKIKIE